MSSEEIMITVIGENIVDFIKQPNGCFKAHLGGSPFNVAIGIGRLGVPCCYLSPLSQDSFGDMFQEYLAENNVRFDQEMRSDFNTSLAFVALDQFQQPHYSIYRTHVADRDIVSTRLIGRMPASTTILHTGSLALEPQDLPVILEVINHARAAGIKISVDLNVRIKFISDISDYIEGIKKIIALCDYIKASDEDLLEIFPELTLEQSVEYVRRHMQNGILAYTKGEHGAELFTRELSLALPVIKPAKFGDTIGAGDTFYATLLSAIVSLGLDKKDACRLEPVQLEALLRNAIMAASINVSRNGCEPPRRAELSKAVAASYGDAAYLQVF
jgi:fructokinase